MSNTGTKDSSFTPAQVDRAVRGLRKAFRNASNAYWEHMKKTNGRFSTFVMRDRKTHAPLYDGDTDYTLYHAQIDFAYIIDDIQRGPTCLASNGVKQANDLIETIFKKSF